MSRLIADVLGTLIGLTLVLAWIGGTVLAPGWWKVVAAIFPFYAWYLVVERAMQLANMV